MLRSALCLAFCLFAAPPAFARRRAVDRPVSHPPCVMVTGTAGVTFTVNRGRTVAPAAERRQPIRHTYGLAVMTDVDDDAETLLAWHGDDLLLSMDSGCSWRVEATIADTGFPPKLEAAAGGRVYAWAENRLFLARYDSRGVSRLRAPAEIVGIAADPANGEHVRVGGSDGSLWESFDGGDSWVPLAKFPASPLVYRFAFNPNDLDHVLAGAVTAGAWVSRDGGRTWTQSTGVSKTTANVFSLLFSPADPNRVWAMGIDNEESQNGHPSHGRHIYVSHDGGSSYRPVVSEREGVKLINGPTMAADPLDPDVLYFVFGTHTFDYGTDLFRYDLASDVLTVEHHDAIDEINAIAFSRRKPSVMYLGLEIVRTRPEDGLR
jgi:hypothetical protein